MPVLYPFDTLRILGGIHPLPAPVEMATQIAGGDNVREREGDDDGLVDGEEGEDGDGEPWLDAFLGGWGW